MSSLWKDYKVNNPKLSISLPPLGILLIEDDSQEAYLIRRTLNQIGNIFWDEDLDSALRTASFEKLDLVLMPLKLKGELSLEPFETFLKLYPEIPIVLLCDAETKLLGEICVQQGAMAILDKNMLENSDYLIKMVTSFIIKAKFIKKADEPLTEPDEPKSTI